MNIKSYMDDTVLDDVVNKFIFEKDILKTFKNQDIWKNAAKAAQ